MKRQRKGIKIFYLFSFIMVLFSSCMAEPSTGKNVDKETIYLVPVGTVEHDLLGHLSREIEQSFPFSVRIGRSLPYPDYAYNEERDQYKSDLILTRLERLELQGAEKILGVTDLDLYTPGLNFVFGQASIGGKVALIALPRLRQEFYGLPEDEKLYYSRAVKEAVHELGHTWGWATARKENA